MGGVRYKNTNRRDVNDRDIRNVFVNFGIPTIQGLPGQGFDYIVVLPRGVYFVEVKPEEKRSHLTDKERDTMRLVNAVCPGHFVILCTSKEAADFVRQT